MKDLISPQLAFQMKGRPSTQLGSKMKDNHSILPVSKMKGYLLTLLTSYLVIEPLLALLVSILAQVQKPQLQMMKMVRSRKTAEAFYY